MSDRAWTAGAPRPEDCLGPTPSIDSDHPSVRAVVARLGLHDLSVVERAARLFEFVRDEFRYEFMAKLTPEEYRASYVLEAGCGFCVQKSVLLCALARSAAVPCALVLSDLVDHSLSARIVKALGTNVMYHHGLNAFYLGGRWLLADASLSPDVVSRKGYRQQGFDGTADALLPATTLTGAAHAEYVRFHGAYANLPFEQMMSAFAAAYQSVDLEALGELGFRLSSATISQRGTQRGMEPK